jgi:transposase
MSKIFRAWDVDQVWLLPPSIQDLVPSGHVAHFVRDTVCTGFDLSRVMDVYDEERGFPAYHPGMMVALLLYAYSQGVYSSRRIGRSCEERLDFAAVTGMQHPDFRTISEFRKRHLAALSGLFQQVLALCREAGLVKLGHVALDGTKIKANAGINKAMSYGRMKAAEPRLAAEVQQWLAQAAQTDKAEDRQFGASKRGDEMPEWMANKEKRLEKIRTAKAALEAEAKAKAETASTPDDDGSGGQPGRKPKPVKAEPSDKAQRNFTDPDSRVMPTKNGFIQGYNAQAAVDGAHQIIVAHTLTNSPSDFAHCRFGPLVGRKLVIVASA